MAAFYLHSDRTVPAIDFLNRCPVADRIEAIVETVRSFPPPSFPPVIPELRREAADRMNQLLQDKDHER